MDRFTGAHEYQDTAIRSWDDKETIPGPNETYDYVFIRDENDEITIAQRVFDDEVQISHLQELDYWNNAYPNSPGATKLTRAQFYTTWDGIRFE